MSVYKLQAETSAGIIFGWYNKRMGDKIITRGRFKGYKIVASSTELINQQGKNVDELLLMIGKYKGWDGDISHVFVSDKSSLCDFNLEDSELRALSVELGFSVSNKDYIHEIALRMKPVS